MVIKKNITLDDRKQEMRSKKKIALKTQLVP